MNGKMVWLLNKSNEGIVDAQISPNGKKILYILSSGSVRIFNFSDRTLITPINLDKGNIEKAQFSSDGKMVLTASKEYSTRLWDASTGTA